MLISITESCHMGCPHCMDDAKPCDRHMNLQTFKDSIDFFNNYGGVECVITGGEPTDNSEWPRMIQYALDNAHGSTGTNVAHITLTTNGMNIVDNYDIQRWLLLKMEKYRKKLSIQVTHVDDLYPIDVSFPDSFLKSVTIATEIESMYPMGRALQNNLPWNSKCSKCFNIRSLVRTYKRLDLATFILTTKFKFCTPQIDYQGYLKLGESCLCPRVSSIYKPINEIINDICNFTCRGCDIINKNLPDNYLEAIGEKRENMK